MVGIDVVEVICVFVVMESAGVLDWWLWSDVEGEGNVDVDDSELDCGGMHDVVGEIWT